MLETSDETVLSNSSTLKYKEIEVLDNEKVRFISLFEILTFRSKKWLFNF